jgi:hypothetical protein
MMSAELLEKVNGVFDRSNGIIHVYESPDAVTWTTLPAELLPAPVTRVSVDGETLKSW